MSIHPRKALEIQRRKPLERPLFAEAISITRAFAEATPTDVSIPADHSLHLTGYTKGFRVHLEQAPDDITLNILTIAVKLIDPLCVVAGGNGSNVVAVSFPPNTPEPPAVALEQSVNKLRSLMTDAISGTEKYVFTVPPELQSINLQPLMKGLCQHYQQTTGQNPSLTFSYSGTYRVPQGLKIPDAQGNRRTQLSEAEVAYAIDQMEGLGRKPVPRYSLLESMALDTQTRNALVHELQVSPARTMDTN